MVAGRPEQAGERAARAEHRRVVGRAGAQAREQLLDLELEHARARARCASRSSSCSAERGDARVEAALLDRRAEDVAPVAARHEVAALVAHDARQQRRRGSCAGRAGAGSGPSPGARGRARRRAARRARPTRRRRRSTTCVGGEPLAAVERDAARRAPSSTSTRATLVSGRSVDARALGGERERRGDERAGRRRGRRGPRARRAGRARAPAPARAPATGSSARAARPEPLAQRELAARAPRPRRGRARRTQRAARAVADVDAADVGELGGERRPAPRALEPEREQRALLRVGLADRREHAGGDRASSPPPSAPRSSTHDAQAARPRAPGDGEPADAAADDRDVPARVLGGWQNGLLASPA